jgi:hypothetical protein
MDATAQCRAYSITWLIQAVLEGPTNGTDVARTMLNRLTVVVAPKAPCHAGCRIPLSWEKQHGSKDGIANARIASKPIRSAISTMLRQFSAGRLKCIGADLCRMT